MEKRNKRKEAKYQAVFYSLLGLAIIFIYLLIKTHIL
tara:strand:+ start:1834 stop:1944 length:111 start_codon:yes stop_codon:yes gene_type:complete